MKDWVNSFAVKISLMVLTCWCTGFASGGESRAATQPELTLPEVKEWRAFVAKVLGTAKLSPAAAVNPEVVTTIARQLGELRPPRVLSDVIMSESVPDQSKAELLAFFLGNFIFDQRGPGISGAVLEAMFFPQGTYFLRWQPLENLFVSREPVTVSREPEKIA